MNRAIALLAGPIALVVVGGCTAAPSPRPAPNPIPAENLQPGTKRWHLPWPGYSLADDIKLQIKGFAGRPTVHPGGHLDLKVTVAPAQPFTVDVFRLGYYQGLGAHHAVRIGPINGVTQPSCTTVSTTGLITCPWITSARIDVPKTWVSGVYYAVLSNARHYQSVIPFWLSDDRPSGLLYLSSLNTYEAYNNFPYDPAASDPMGLPRTGRSLYVFNSARSVASVKVSFDRPFTAQNGGSGAVLLSRYEPELIQFLEKSGYDVSYANDPLIDENPRLLLTHKAIVIAGHAEYWTKAAYDGAVAARNAGVGLAFISANEIYWQVRYEPNEEGTARRVVVGYKANRGDLVPTPLRTTEWRRLGRPEQKLIGVQYPEGGFQDQGGQPLVPQHTDSWVFKGSGLKAGVPLRAELVGYEIDAFDPTVGKPEGTDFTLLAASPFRGRDGHWYTHNSSIYRSRGGNWVWATGSMAWTWGLSPGGSSKGGNNVRREIQVVTTNVLNRMLHDAPGHR